MANTTNYNWETPDDTDLVKDGAAAIRTLGSSIDTTTKNLNPQTTTGAIAYRSATANVNTALPIGTANQVLRVNSGGTAPEWATTADQTPLTTKGDLFGFNTADARIPIGTDGHILTADSTQSLGLKWAAPASGSTFVGCRLFNSADQTIANATATAVTFNSESFDTNSFHSTSSNTSRITIPSGKDGYYLFAAGCRFNADSATGIRAMYLYKNGAEIWAGTFFAPTNTTVNETLTYTQIFSAVATDYFELYVYQSTGGNYGLNGGSAKTTLQATYLGA
jgi:hypothetical protein